MKILNIVSIVGLAFITSACGNMKLGNDDLRTSSYDQMTAAGTSNPYLSAAQTCSENPNITSANTQYRACKSTNNNIVSVKIFSVEESSKTVCIYPVQVNGSYASPFVVNPSAPAQSRYAVQCVSASLAGATANFTSIALNGIYVVDQAHSAMFAQCLAYGDVRTCSSLGGFTYSNGRL
jgi:hypothetical protein